MQLLYSFSALFFHITGGKRAVACSPSVLDTLVHLQSVLMSLGIFHLDVVFQVVLDGSALLALDVSPAPITFEVSAYFMHVISWVALKISRIGFATILLLVMVFKLGTCFHPCVVDVRSLILVLVIPNEPEPWLTGLILVLYYYGYVIGKVLFALFSSCTCSNLLFKETCHSVSAHTDIISAHPGVTENPFLNLSKPVASRNNH
jgi:hypothetical protein